MCLAIYKPKGVEIKKSYLRNGFTSNNDGCGFVFSDGKRLHISKFGETETFDTFWKAYRHVSAKRAMLIHFRFATHGKHDYGNTHPIEILDGEFAVVHNGVLDIKTHGDWSDTRTFAEFVLAPALERFEFSHPALAFLIESTIDVGNKIVVMRSDGKVNLFNERIGVWHKGAWYSNSGYKEARKRFGCSLGSTETMWSKLGYGARTSANQTVFDEGSDEVLEAYIEETSKANLDYEKSNHQIITEQ